VVIDDFDIVSVAALPLEADSPLIIDSDAVLPFPVVLQLFEAIARRDSEVIETDGSVDLKEFSQGHPVDFRRQFFRAAPIENRFRFPASEAENHRGLSWLLTYTVNITRDGNSVNEFRFREVFSVGFRRFTVGRGKVFLRFREAPWRGTWSDRKRATGKNSGGFDGDSRETENLSVEYGKDSRQRR